ncbi:hypothetical protein [Streptomyces sp. rh34]|uniref:hypothetical protein n=1 Tax=Streptomyces sp. rh34 TaxID=2034272 RepID=UPI00211D287E|nr:hypothetical protein [Streptomyces sp. rh34]
MSLLSVIVMVFAKFLVPDAPGQSARTRAPPGRVLGMPGVASVTLFIVAAAFLAAAQQSTVLVLLAIVLWGLGSGGSATQLQTAMSETAGENADAANAMLTTSFDMAIFAGGAAGALVVDGVGAPALPAGMIALSLVALVSVGFGRRAAFPAGR